MPGPSPGDDCTFDPRVLFIDMNSFFASVEQQEERSLRNRPVAVVPIVSDTTSVISASYEARAFGIKTGTNVGDARIRCPGLRLVKARHRLYVSYHYQLIEALRRFFVEIHPMSVDEMACTLSSRQRTGDLAALVRSVKDHIHASLGPCLKSSIGIAPNVFLAKVAADFQKPDGFTHFGDTFPELLKQLQLTDLPGIARRMAVRLNMHGIYTVDDLWNASRQRLRSVWGGIVGERWYFMIRGHLKSDYGMHDSDEHKSIGQSHVLPPQFRTSSGVRSILLRLASKALRRLRGYGLGARSVSYKISFRHRHEFRQKHSWTKTMHQTFYANDDIYWLRDIGRSLEEAPPLETFYPFKISIAFSDLSPCKNLQIGIFEDRSGFSRLFSLIDALNEDYGQRVAIADVYHLKDQAPFRIAFSRSFEHQEL